MEVLSFFIAIQSIVFFAYARLIESILLNLAYAKKEQAFDRIKN
jgi:hypothetical protein